MAGVADTARLLSSLELQDKFSGPAKAAQGALGGLERGSSIVQRGFGLLGQAGNAVGGAFNHLKGRIGDLLSGPLGMLGLGAGIGGVIALIKGGVDQVKEFGSLVGGLSKITGLSAEQTSRLAGAFHRFGIEADTAKTIAGIAVKNLFNLTQTTDSAAKQSNELTKAQRDLTLAELKLNETRAKRNVTDSQLLQAENRVADAQEKLNLIIEEGGAVAGGAAGFFKKYGLALVDSSGKIKDFNTLLLDSSDFFLNKQIPAAQKAAALAAVYGRNWQALIPILGAGRQAIADAEEEAARLGLTLTKDNLDALKKLREATRTWGLALGGLKLQLGLAVVPLLTDLTKGATSFLTTVDKFGRTGMQKVVSFFKGLIDFGKQAFGVIQTQVVPVVQNVIKAWNDLPAPLKSILTKGVAGNFAIKFLLGFSPVDIAAAAAGAVAAKLAGAAASAIGGIFTGFIGDFIGKTAANKLIPQVVVGPAAGVLPVFVTNPGFGTGGGGIVDTVVGGAATAFGISVATLVGLTAGILGLTTISGSDMSQTQQADYLTQQLRKGLSVKEALDKTGATLAAVVELVSHSANLEGLSKEQIAELQALANQPGIALPPSGAATPLGQFDPKNFGGSPFKKGIFGDVKGGLVALPDTAMSPGGTAVKLPDTAMAALTTTATETKKLPPILTRQEIAAQTLNAKLAATVPKGQARPDLSVAIVGAVQNSSSASNAWSARQLAAFAQGTAAQRTTAGKAGEIVARSNELRAAIGRGFGDLGGAQRQVAARVAEARNAINVGNSIQRIIAGKIGPPTVLVKVINQVTISEIQRKITSQQIAVGKGPLESF